jgi:hypothetical protein
LIARVTVINPKIHYSAAGKTQEFATHNASRQNTDNP